MRNFYILGIMLILSFVVNAQTTIDISKIDAAYTKTVDGALVIDVATTASKVAAPKLSFDNPFKGKTFTEAELSFDVYNYFGSDSTHVLGSLISIFDAALGRMYFSNGSYLGYNDGTYFDANMISYKIGTDFIGSKTWKNIRLKFTSTGYAMYVDNVLAFDQSSTSVTIAGNLTDYGKVITFMQNASILVIGTGSWWSDNTRGDGSYFDYQFSYLKNIKFTTSGATAVGWMNSNNNGKLISEEYFNISGQKVGSDYNLLGYGIYIKRALFSSGAIKCTKIIKVQ